MKSIVICLCALCVSMISPAATEPSSVSVGGQSSHVQGIAYDEASSRMYYSFTTRFVVTDLDGQIIGSIDNIHGHLGSMTFDSGNRKVYASLECKNDEIGAAISRKMGIPQFEDSYFYIAEIDVDAIDSTGVPQEAALRRLQIPTVSDDFNAEVNVGGRLCKHKFGCTGIDGVTTGPDFGGKGGEFLYVAYGVKSDTTRSDNDYQILLQFKMSDVRKGKMDSPRKYFIKTGNTSYGVQNLAYDPFTGMMFMAVYKGKKKQYPNYDLFAVNMKSKPVKARLEGVPYERKAVNTIPLATDGWSFKYGSKGICPLGDGRWYIAEDGKTTDSSSRKTLHYCNAALYRWVPGADAPFKKL